MRKHVAHDVQTALDHFRDLKPAINKYGKRKTNKKTICQDIIKCETEKVYLFLTVALLSQFTTTGPKKT